MKHFALKRRFSIFNPITSSYFNKNIIPLLTNEKILSQITIWWRAIKLPIYSVVIIPTLVAAVCVYSYNEIFYFKRIQQLIVSSTIIIAWLNLSNDVFDAATGVDLDGRKPESVVNLLGWKNDNIKALASVFLGYGLVYLSNLNNVARPSSILLIKSCFACSILLGYIYQGPPMRLSYMGLGEPLCFMSFGPLATTALYLSIMPIYAAIDSGVKPILFSTITILIGLSTTSILFCSHFHQVVGDRISGKMSPIVKFGTAKSSVILLTSIFTYIAFEIVLTVLKILPPFSFPLRLLSLVSGCHLVSLVWYNHNKKLIVASSKIYSSLWHILNGLSIISSIIINSDNSQNIL